MVSGYCANLWFGRRIEAAAEVFVCGVEYILSFDGIFVIGHFTTHSDVQCMVWKSVYSSSERRVSLISLVHHSEYAVDC